MSYFKGLSVTHEGKQRNVAESGLGDGAKAALIAPLNVEFKEGRVHMLFYN